MEKWKKHPTIKRLMVSNMGNFKLKGSSTVRAVKVNNFGYRILAWRSENSRWWDSKSIKCTNLVAETWLGPRPKGLVISHKNEDKTDDRVENIEYVTQSENEANKTHKGIKGNHIKNRLGIVLATQIREEFNTLSLIQLSKKYGRSVSTISKIISNKSYPDPNYRYVRSTKKEAAKQHERFKENVTKWSKLSPEKVRAIRVLISEGKRDFEIAPLYGVKDDTIFLIRHGRRWKWVD
jgi:hypothetical protein